jgi:hypothetical protein
LYNHQRKKIKVICAANRADHQNDAKISRAKNMIYKSCSCILSRQLCIERLCIAFPMLVSCFISILHIYTYMRYNLASLQLAVWELISMPIYGLFFCGFVHVQSFRSHLDIIYIYCYDLTLWWSVGTYSVHMSYIYRSNVRMWLLGPYLVCPNMDTVYQVRAQASNMVNLSCY